MVEEIDIFQSLLVPKHEILSDGDKKALLEQFHIAESALPKIRLSDPAVKALDAQKGDVIRIFRKSPTAGDCLYYRHVVA